MQEEVGHLIDVITQAEEALYEHDANKLRDLSNQTIHQASAHQDEGCITLAVLIYTLSKLIERQDHGRIKNWDRFIPKFSSFMNLAIKALKDNNEEKYQDYLESARKTLSTISVSTKPYIQEVLRKASINKASKIYEHGISMGRTAKMLGITQWELSEYTGQKSVSDNPYNETLSVKKRAAMAMEFFK
ncbi:MAG: hypothetical protein WCK29_00615 [archaeon]